MEELSTFAYLMLGYVGVAVFAGSGAMAAAKQKHDIITFSFFAAITGLGGGTLRDILLDIPVFWIADPIYLLICLVTGCAFWVLGSGRWEPPVFLWLDAIGLVAFAILGAAKSLAFGAPPLVCIVMGVFTATLGGIIRDMVSGEPSILLRREIYLTATILASAAYIVLLPFTGSTVAIAAGFILGFGLRALAIIYNWSLPEFTGGLRGRK